MSENTKVCPECRHVFQGNGWDGIDAHWRAKHEDIMPYEEAWPLLSSGNYKKVYKIDGETICVRFKEGLTVHKYTDVIEVVEDHEGSEGHKFLHLKRNSGAAVVVEVIKLSEEVDAWWQE